jgi:hypothetical protein
MVRSAMNGLEFLVREFLDEYMIVPLPSYQHDSLTFAYHVYYIVYLL